MSEKLYLAGKVSKNCWRHQFVEGLRDAYTSTDYAERNRVVGGDMWPELRDAIAPGVDYVGPFFVSDDHGCFHEPGWHGSYDRACGEAYMIGKHGGDDDWVRADTVKLCLRAVERCTTMLAVIADDAHGTLVEVGYAVAKGKNVVVTNSVFCDAEPYMEREGEAWFALHLPGTHYRCCATHWISDIAMEAEWTAALRSDESKCASPVELAFLRELRSRPSGYHRFKPNVSVMNGRYRIDFGDTQRLIGVEIDGYAYHSDKETFTKDRQRQRELERIGWRLVRYSGKELHDDPASVVDDFLAWLAVVES